MQRVPFVMIVQWDEAMRLFLRAADGVAAEMRAFAKAADEMQVRRLAQTPSTVVRPAFPFVALVPRTVDRSRRSTYFADGADLEYG